LRLLWADADSLSLSHQYSAFYKSLTNDWQVSACVRACLRGVVGGGGG
jgi:cobalamin biosynthesis Mg chelatase CobN